MELDDMKNLWQKYETAVEKNKILNEKMIKIMMKEKSAGHLAKLKNTEYFGVVFCIALAAIFLTMTGKAMTSSIAMISFLMMIFAMAGSVVWGMAKINLLKSIDLAESSLTDVSLKMDRFRLMINKERLVGLVAMPFLVVCCLIVIDGYDSAMLMNRLPGLLAGMVAGIAIAFLLYKTMYFDKIDAVKSNIEEVKAFRNEEL